MYFKLKLPPLYTCKKLARAWCSRKEKQRAERERGAWMKGSRKAKEKEEGGEGCG